MLHARQLVQATETEQATLPPTACYSSKLFSLLPWHEFRLVFIRNKSKDNCNSRRWDSEDANLGSTTSLSRWGTGDYRRTARRWDFQLHDVPYNARVGPSIWACFVRNLESISGCWEVFVFSLQSSLCHGKRALSRWHFICLCSPALATLFVHVKDWKLVRIIF